MTDLAFHHLVGSPYDVGVGLGHLGTPAVHHDLTRTEAWAMSRKADGRVQLMASLVRSHCAAMPKNCAGLADGLDLPFHDVFAWNCRGDLWAMAPEGCTTVQIPGRDRRIVAHNEHGLPGFAGRCFLVRIERTGYPGVLSFVYPGSLPGHTFAMTGRGLVQTVNNVRINDASAGLRRIVLGRTVLDSPDLDSAVTALKTAPRAGGFHMTLAQVGDPRVLSVRFVDHGVSVVEIGTPAVHSNHPIHATMFAGSFEAVGWHLQRSFERLPRESDIRKPQDGIQVGRKGTHGTVLHSTALGHNS